MQLILSVSAFLALVASTLALQVTAPAEGSSVDLTKDNKIEWKSVSTDKDSFNIFLTNNNVNPPVRIPIASNVQTSSGSYDVKSVQGAVPGGNYRINLESASSNDQGILAQSGQFTVASAGSSSTSSASFSSSTPSTSAASTVTSTKSESGSVTTSTTTASTTASTKASTSGSASGSATAGSTSGSASGSSSSAKPSSSGGASSLNTFAGAGVFAMVAALLA